MFVRVNAPRGAQGGLNFLKGKIQNRVQQYDEDELYEMKKGWVGQDDWSDRNEISRAQIQVLLTRTACIYVLSRIH